MKKLILLFSIILISITVFSQTVTKSNQLKQDSIVKPVMVVKVIDTNKAVVVPKSEVNALKVVADSAITTAKAQQDTIAKQKSIIQQISDSASDNLWGGKPWTYYFWALFTVMLGMIGSWSLLASIAIKKSKEALSWGEFFKPENVIKRIARFIFAVVGSFALVRYVFPSEFGLEASMPICFFIGFNWDYWLEWWKKRKQNPKVPIEATDKPV